MKNARVAQPSWRRVYLAPSYHAGATQHAYALQVLAQILGGGAGSRLHQNLVLKDAIALGAGADYAPTALGLTTFSVHASPKAGVSVAALEAAELRVQFVVEHLRQPAVERRVHRALGERDGERNEAGN